MINYFSGFGNHFVSEAIPNSLPQGCNSPQHAPHGLYAEQISGSAFTMPRHNNFRTWVYRIRPSVVGGEFKLYTTAPCIHLKSTPFNGICPPNQLRWNPLLPPIVPTDFIHGLMTMCGNGCTNGLNGGAIHIYSINQSMQDFFYNADAEMLFIPQQGNLLLKTELGLIELEPLEIAVIPRGIKFQVVLPESNPDKFAYGYVCENYGIPFKLPDLGPIGSNGLANPRDFLTPVAHYEHITDGNDNSDGKDSSNYSTNLICKFEGNLWKAELTHSPLDVVAWHGNYVPYKYDLRNFNTIGTVSFDHPDPSIFTVLTSPTAIAGMANIDFVIFPPRHMVAENTFRPPWYHRNIMSEFMGLIAGQYDAKPDGFTAGSASLHNRMTAHGPDGNSCQKALEANLKPEYLANTMAFMLESSQVWRPTQFALETPQLQKNYNECWQNIPILFKE
jgi:homogentisate 1,2-dioxygenase